MRAGAALVDAWLISSLVKQPGSGAHQVFGAKTANLLGLLLAGAATLRAVIALWGPRQSTQSWRKGAEGEVMTAKALEALPLRFVVLHDLPMPGSRANIDHLVIGSTGVFTVETKHYSSDVVVRHGTARHAGRSMDAVVEQANRQAEVVRTVLGTTVRAVVCIQGAAVSIEGWFTKPLVDGVRFCSGRRLVEALTRVEPELNTDEIERLVVLAERELQRSPRTSAVTSGPVCACGSRMLLRRRRADNVQFWGCPGFPTCRHTLPRKSSGSGEPTETRPAIGISNPTACRRTSARSAAVGSGSGGEPVGVGGPSAAKESAQGVPQADPLPARDRCDR